MWKTSIGASREPMKTVSNTEGTGAHQWVACLSVQSLLRKSPVIPLQSPTSQTSF